MSTFKSRRPGRWTKYNANPENIKRRTAARDAARIAGPAPTYPPAAPVHGDWINGHTVIARLMRDPKHRCDQWAAEIDGEVAVEAAGLTALWQILHKRWPKAMSLRTLATLRS